tara:strand:+ start:10212 stop:10571 length:360 start_codon:yes stop_codon:yes gene_type:complete
MSFNPDTAWMDPKYNTTSSSNNEETILKQNQGRAAAFGKRRKRPVLSRGRIRDAAEAMKDEPSLDPRKSTCSGILCNLKFWGGKRRTKKRRKKRRTKSRRKTKRRRKSRRRTKRRRRKR